MIDTTPWWLIAIFAVIAILFWIGMELRHQRKNPGKSHYIFNQSGSKYDTRHLQQFINTTGSAEDTAILNYDRGMKDLARNLKDGI